MQTIEQTYSIEAPAGKVWWALTTVEGAEGWGAGPAKFDAIEGSAFSDRSGDIHGINTRIVPESLLEQDWYGHDHPEEKYRTSFRFKSRGGTTMAHLIYAGHIYNEQRDLADWQGCYFDPIKKLLEQV